MNKKVFYTIVTILILTITAFAIGIGYLVIKNKKIQEVIDNPNIYNNIYIENINVSEISKEKALLKLNENISLNEKIILKYKDKEYVYNKKDLGFEYNFQEAVENAYNIARQGTDEDRYNKIINLRENPQIIQLTYTLNEEKLNLVIADLEKQLNKEPVDPTLKKTSNGFEVVGEETGLKLNSEKIKQDIIATLNEKNDVYLTLEVNEVKSDKAEQLKMVQHKLGSFSTKYKRGANDEGRITNMKIAANNINGTLLYPGEVFSTNKQFGPTTKANGYKPAPTIINGKLIDEYGGGVCQVSSTLYNSVLFSELDIVERRNHSLKVGYLDYGYDATLAGDYIDFKFKNNTNYPIYIESYLTENEVICNIYGYEERPSNRQIKFENVLVETIPPGPRIEKETDELPLGEEKVEVRALTGYKYNLYKLIYEDGKLIEKVLVNNSYYRPRAEEVLVGTKEVVAPTNSSQDTPISETSVEQKTIQ